MKLKDLYLEAARKVAEGETVADYSCYAVHQTVDAKHFGLRMSDTVLEVQRYCRVFSPSGQYFSFCSEVFDAFRNSRGHRRPKKERNLRVLMLCLMAECWKDFK